MFINYGNTIDGVFIILDLVGFYILFEGVLGGWEASHTNP